MADLEKFHNDRIEAARKKLSESIPDAIDGMIDMAKNAKAEAVRLQAIKTVLEQNDAYEKVKSDQENVDRDVFVDTQIVILLKELMRKTTFINAKKDLGPGADPYKIVELREQTDALFGLTDVVEADVVPDSEEEDED